MKQFKEGDWIFYEFNLYQIETIDPERGVLSITDSHFNRGGYSLTEDCFPMSLDVKYVSDNVRYYYNEIHKFKGLNFPDIQRELVRRWKEIINCEPDKRKILWENLESFYRDIKGGVEKRWVEVVGNIKLFS